MNANLQDLRAEARAEMNERFHEVSESDAVWLDTLIDSVLDRVEACAPVARVPELVDGKYANDYEEGLQDGSDSCRAEMLTNLSTLRS